VVVSTNGSEALEAARSFRPEVAVVDIGLPGMNGYVLAQHLRAEHSDIRLVALTGYGQASDIAAAAAAGFAEHCAKPISIAALLDVIAARRQV
jgi:CheY-like chemotaxis protein